MEAAGAKALADFSLLPATVNGATYFHLRRERSINCLDRERSRFKPFPSDPQRIMHIHHYAFTSRVPSEARFFCIPESGQLLATNAMVERLSAFKLKGLELEPLPFSN